MRICGPGVDRAGRCHPRQIQDVPRARSARIVPRRLPRRMSRRAFHIKAEVRPLTDATLDPIEVASVTLPRPSWHSSRDAREQFGTALSILRAVTPRTRDDPATTNPRHTIGGLPRLRRMIVIWPACMDTCEPMN